MYGLPVSIVLLLASACSLSPSNSESNAVVALAPDFSRPDWQEITPGVLEKKNADGSMVRYAFGEDGLGWLIDQASNELVGRQAQYSTTQDASELTRINQLQDFIEGSGGGANLRVQEFEGTSCSGGGGTCTCGACCSAQSDGCMCHPC